MVDTIKREIKFITYIKERQYMSKPWTLDEEFPTEEKVIYRQFTGLKDKNGKEIYEGDLLKLDEKENWVYPIVEVIFDSAEFTTKITSLNKLGEVEVIGNIYENPGLI